MNSHSKRLFLSTAIAILMFSAPLPAQSPLQVSRSFQITVRDSDQQPKANVRVTLGKQNAYTLQAIMRGNTSAEGALNFAKIAPGRYTLQFVDPTGETNTIAVEVVPTGGQGEVVFSWPYIHWITMKSVSGVLMAGASPLNHRIILVRTFPEGGEVASAATDRQGTFDAPVNTPGRYTLDVSYTDEKGITERMGTIYAIVTLEAAGRNPEILYLDSTPNGLDYDRLCTRDAAEAADSCFQVIDKDGRPLPSSLLTLRSEGGYAKLEKYITDAEGKVRLPVFPAGTYEAFAFAKGFTPARMRMKLNGNAGTCSTPLKIPLNVIGQGCAPATAGKVD